MIQFRHSSIRIFRSVICKILFKNANTVNDKSFEGEKFRGLLGSSGMRGKVLQFFHHHLHTFMVFQLYKTSISTKTWILLKTVISILGNWWESTLMCDCVYRFHIFQNDHAVTGLYSWSESEMKQITNSFLISFFCKLFPNLLAETSAESLYIDSLPLQNFSWCQLSAEQKF